MKPTRREAVQPRRSRRDPRIYDTARNEFFFAFWSPPPPTQCLTRAICKVVFFADDSDGPRDENRPIIEFATGRRHNFGPRGAIAIE
ncbi:Hypothetical protein NTJ_09069 [Nesidiocoris tenuis]|uniref:Uncharacterized protein n=1 Tax=Nesidiocoris tenuis TaxID=355587 RepID=A0ABN7AVP8_9HEMI|nr:Hypothetical protein NTJ_09069 [Nesidiocoris tenuis]